MCRLCFPPMARCLTKQHADRLLRSPIEHITLSFDGSTKESFEYYRKGAQL